jgi:Terminase RNaseH-like domain
VDWVLAAQQRWRAEDPYQYAGEPVVMGVDIARYGSASWVVVVKQGPRVLEIQAWKGNSLTSTTGRIILLAQKYNAEVINVDDPEVGGGVVDMLAQEGLPVQGVNTGTPAIHAPEKFINLKSEISFRTRGLLRQALISARC